MRTAASRGAESAKAGIVEAATDVLALQGTADPDLDLGPAYGPIPHLPDLTRQRRYPQS